MFEKVDSEGNAYFYIQKDSYKLYVGKINIADPTDNFLFYKIMADTDGIVISDQIPGAYDII
jgi:hypothetical protein